MNALARDARLEAALLAYMRHHPVGREFAPLEMLIDGLKAAIDAADRVKGAYD